MRLRLREQCVKRVCANLRDKLVGFNLGVELLHVSTSWKSKEHSLQHLADLLDPYCLCHRLALFAITRDSSTVDNDPC